MCVKSLGETREERTRQTAGGTESAFVLLRVSSRARYRELMNQGEDGGHQGIQSK